MSDFKVTYEEIKAVKQHDNADRLEIVRLAGIDYQFVTQLGLYKAGDKVVYFPVDSLLPQWIMDVLELTQLAHGAVPDDGSERLRNRVKTVKLRGQISQGVVCPWLKLAKANPKGALRLSPNVGMDMTDILGVTKYEPPVIAQRGGDLVRMPDMVSVYDIEGAQRYPEQVKRLMDEPVTITEKVEGSNWWASLDAFGEFEVGQRNYAIKPNGDGTHDWWKVADVLNIKEILQEIFDEITDDYDDFRLLDGFHPTEDEINVHRVTLRGEMVGPGVQGNYYKLKDHTVYMFELEINGTPVNSKVFFMWMDKHKLTTAPIIATDMTLREWLDGNNIVDASDGRSVLVDRLREGIVVKTYFRELQDETLGRLFIKQRSPAYLAKTDN